ncbi:hypothetical protein HYT84_02650, partial [Candidatus Micrarchaeota archaeon]|nr:hypothetical protein [Candidatus Micrarchaeota archaeon]
MVLPYSQDLNDKLLRCGSSALVENNLIKITTLEAAYFSEKGVINLEEKQEKELAKLKKKKDFSEKFLVYKHFFDRGYPVRTALDTDEYLRVYRKGVKVGEDIVYLVKDRLEAVLRDTPYTILEEMKGLDLVGMKYEPIESSY